MFGAGSANNSRHTIAVPGFEPPAGCQAGSILAETGRSIIFCQHAQLFGQAFFPAFAQHGASFEKQQPACFRTAADLPEVERNLRIKKAAPRLIAKVQQLRIGPVGHDLRLMQQARHHSREKCCKRPGQGHGCP